MSFSYGKKMKITIFGQSHAEAIGVVMEHLPAGETIDMETLQAFLNRRAPGQNAYSTKRSEADIPQIVSGLSDGKTCGAPLCAIIQNTDVRSGDYKNLKDCPRPGHADFPAFIKYDGNNDIRGGGQFSGRLTAPLCIAGGICKQILSKKGITIGAHIYSIHQISDLPFDPVNLDAETLNQVTAKDFPLLDDTKKEPMLNIISGALEKKDSVGGIVELAAVGLPVGLGTHMFDGMESRLSSVLFGIPAVKGVEFGAGFGAAGLFGSENNDPYYYDGATVKTKTNNHGGILGGMTSGMPLILRVVFKPTPSIGLEQDSVSFSEKTNTKLSIKGRHDPCIVPRAVPCVEAAAAIALLDCLLEGEEIL